MTTITLDSTVYLSTEEVAQRAEEIYRETIREQVEVPENIGKMVIIDIETKDFGVDKLGFESADMLREKNPFAQLYGIRIGYDVAASFGGAMMRRTSK